MYGSGLRIMELLRIKDIDFSYNSMGIWHSKGNKNRGITLAPELTASLRTQIQIAKQFYPIAPSAPSKSNEPKRT